MLEDHAALFLVPPSPTPPSSTSSSISNKDESTPSKSKSKQKQKDKRKLGTNGSDGEEEEEDMAALPNTVLSLFPNIHTLTLSNLPHLISPHLSFLHRLPKLRALYIDRSAAACTSSGLKVLTGLKGLKTVSCAYSHSSLTDHTLSLLPKRTVVHWSKLDISSAGGNVTLSFKNMMEMESKGGVSKERFTDDGIRCQSSTHFSHAILSLSAMQLMLQVLYV